MTVRLLVGEVVSGIGDLSRWMRKYADIYRDATGMDLVPGSLNVELDREFRLPDTPRIHLDAEQVGVDVSLVPCHVEGIPAFILRTDRNDAGIGDHPRQIIEVVADVVLRDELRLEDGDRVEVVVPRDL